MLTRELENKIGLTDDELVYMFCVYRLLEFTVQRIPDSKVLFMTAVLNQQTYQNFYYARYNKFLYDEYKTLEQVTNFIVNFEKGKENE